MKRQLEQLVAVLCIGCSSGCATTAHGWNQTVTITSEPSGAKVTVLSATADGSMTVRSRPGITPLQVKLPRRDPRMVIRFEKEGCPPEELRVKRSVSGWTFGNLIFANPFAGQGADSPAAAGSIFIGLVLTTGAGMLIDAGTGAAFNLPTWLHATLCPPPRGESVRQRMFGEIDPKRWLAPFRGKGASHLYLPQAGAGGGVQAGSGSWPARVS
jgi:hypothetical protein